MSLAVPISLPKARRIPWVLMLVIGLAVASIVAVALALSLRDRRPAVAGQFYAIVPMDMDITIAKDGELGAVNNVEITNPVEGQNTIVEIAKEGDFVHKGDIVCKLDSSEIERKIENSTLDLQKAQS